MEWSCHGFVWVLFQYQPSETEESHELSPVGLINVGIKDQVKGGIELRVLVTRAVRRIF